MGVVSGECLANYLLFLRKQINGHQKKKVRGGQN